MPPTFPIILGFIAYFGLIVLTLLVTGPMLIFEKTKRQAKIILLTGIISYPTLLIVGLTMSLICILPAIGLGYLLDKLDLINIFGYFIFAFLGIVAIFALYHWYIGYTLIRNYCHRRQIDDGIRNDKIYKLFVRHIVSYYGLDRPSETNSS
jgi:hypothetical protein